MTGRPYVTSESSDGPVEELSIVALSRAFFVPEEDRTLPAGASGTVVAVLKHGEAYIVEFTEPFAALVDLIAADVSAVPGRSRADLVAGNIAYRAS